MQRINITLPDELANDLRRSIPVRSRSKFIAKALKEKLTLKRNFIEELAKSLKDNREFYQKVAAEWKVTEVEAWPN